MYKYLIIVPNQKYLQADYLGKGMLGIFDEGIVRGTWIMEEK